MRKKPKFKVGQVVHCMLDLVYRRVSGVDVYPHDKWIYYRLMGATGYVREDMLRRLTEREAGR